MNQKIDWNKAYYVNHKRINIYSNFNAKFKKLHNKIKNKRML
jgi:hypothetical protein